MMIRRFLQIFLCFLAPNLHAIDPHRMTLEEKVGQLFLVYFDGEEVNAEAEILIREAKVGGIIYYQWANGLHNAHQVQALSNGLQMRALQATGIPLFIAMDQEGGLKMRMEQGMTEFPGNAALGVTKEPRLAYESAYHMGRELKAAGINFNLAPVVDVNNNPANPVIGIRSFGDDPVLVTTLGEAALRGYCDAGILCCLKHFPGHGDVQVDSHLGLPVVRKSLPELQEMELTPFRKLSTQAPAIMSAHLLMPSLDPDHCATLSPAILQDLLREKFQFKGLILSDSLTMQGVLKGSEGIEDVAIRAFLAGNDMLLIGGRDFLHKKDDETNVDEILRIYQAVLAAVRSGRINQERLDQSVERILLMKHKSGLFTRALHSPKEVNEALRNPEALRAAREIAYRSVELPDSMPRTDFSSKHLIIIAPDILEDKIRATDLMQLGRSSRLLCYDTIKPSAGAYDAIHKQISEADVVLFCTFNAWQSNLQRDLLQQVTQSKPTVAIATRDARDLELAPDAIATFATRSPTSCSLQVVAEWLSGKTHPLHISEEEGWDIGRRIWHNECSHREDQLTFWSPKEPFPSMGIGHFIWPPENYHGIFARGRFHTVIAFLQEQGVSVPDWIADARFSPWTSREAFYQDFESPRMKELRQFLVDTIPYQAQYMVERLNEAFYQIILTTPPPLRHQMIAQFFEVSAHPNGPYILVDYLNFKHEGTATLEQYKGQGWGLLQVLERMISDPATDRVPPPARFAAAAQSLLEARIANAPDPDKERQWLPGWKNRLATYVKH